MIFFYLLGSFLSYGWFFGGFQASYPNIAKEMQNADRIFSGFWCFFWPFSVPAYALVLVVSGYGKNVWLSWKL